MKQSLFPVVIAVSLFLFAFPSEAMMGSDHGHWSSGQSSGEPRDQSPRREPESQPSGHRHGDYYHSHEGGQFPHSHDEARPASEAPKSEAAPAPTPASKQPATVKPSRKTAGKTIPESRPKQKTSTKEAATKETATRETVVPVPTEKSSPATPSAPLETSTLARDEVMMRLVRVSGAESVKGQGDAKRGKEDIGDFYMDETPVTNYQYVEFLNKVIESIKVENGIVWGNGEMWLLLGEVMEGYEPIVFQDGRFRVNAAHHAACAVLRVTALGAMAYTRFHGESLPTEEQWVYAVRAGAAEGPPAARDVPGSPSGISGHGDPEGDGDPAASPTPAHTPAVAPSNPALPAHAPATSPEAGAFPPIPSPVMLYPANALGIRGLNANIGEWGLRTVKAPAQGGGEQQEFVVMGGAPIRSAQGTSNPRAIRRYPWEAFSEVGFRGVREVSDAMKGGQSPGAGG